MVWSHRSIRTSSGVHSIPGPKSTGSSRHRRRPLFLRNSLGPRHQRGLFCALPRYSPSTAILGPGKSEHSIRKIQTESGRNFPYESMSIRKDHMVSYTGLPLGKSPPRPHASTALGRGLGGPLRRLSPHREHRAPHCGTSRGTNENGRPEGRPFQIRYCRGAYLPSALRPRPLSLARRERVAE